MVARTWKSTIRRLKAFEAAGADALYAPGLTKAEDIPHRLQGREQTGERCDGTEVFLRFR